LGTEQVALRQAAGRVLAAPVAARRAQPPFAASAMDGYALRAAELAIGARFRVTAEAAAGHGYAGAVGPGEAVRIFTGAPVPQGADHVVIQEDVDRAGDEITIGEKLGSGSNIRPAGSDFAVGDKIAAPRMIRPADLALIASMNCAEVTVTRRPVVALIATGDELRMPGEDPGPDQIIASNAFALAGMVEAAGGEARLLPIARDTEAALRHVLSLAEDADMIVTIGGASVGDHDLVGQVAAGMGMERAFYKIAMRPGKPLMAGRLMGKPMLGLPGNPVSAIVCGHLFLLPALRAMLGLGAEAPQSFEAVLSADVGETGPREHYMRAQLVPGSGAMAIRPFDRQDSSLLSILTAADALLIRPRGDGARRVGERVRYIPL
ncbi:molybdopterin molybdotransferase MoeA, partial [Thioclava sp. BHET1]